MRTDPKINNYKSYSLLIVFFTMTASIIILGVLYFRNYEKQYRTEVENQLTAIADLKAGELKQWRNERLGDGNIFYKNEVFSDLVKRYFKNQNDLDAKKRILAWMRQVQISNYYNGVFLLDAQFTKKLVIPENSENNKAFVSQNTIDSLKSGKIVFEDFYKQELNQRIFLKVVIPILDKKNNNQVIAIIQLRIDPQDYLYPLINKWPTSSKTSETTISKREGNDVVFLNELKYKEKTALNLRIPLDKKEIIVVKAVLGETGIVEGVDYRGVKVIADVRIVPNSPWYLVTKMDKSEMYAPVREKQWTMVVLIIGFIFCLGGVIRLIWNQKRIRYYKDKSIAADKLNIANKELVFQKNEKEKRADELIIADKELDFQNKEKGKRAAELIIANKELTFQNKEKLKRADELIIANKELLFQNEEKKKRAAELIIANKELVFQSEEKGKRAAELIIANKELTFQNKEKQKRADELYVANKELLFQNEEKEKQEVANKELEAFSYSVSHDLRSPLRHIGGFADLLIKNNSSQLDETGLRYLKIISESTIDMGNLIDALLTFSRLSRTELQRTKINTKSMVNRIITSFNDELAGRNVEINVSDLPDAMGDEQLISQVWINLISNALKYSRNKEKAVIDIGARTENDETIFYIKDNGAGFDMKYADKLFGVFQRLHKARDFEGIGIGLANVNRIITRHGGKCWAEGEVGKGATFFFSKPNN